MDKKEQTEKFKTIDPDYKMFLLHKYLSDKTIDGEDIFNLEVNINSKTTKASRKPHYQSFLDLDDKAFRDMIVKVLEQKGPEPSEKTPGAGPTNEKDKGKSN